MRTPASNASHAPQSGAPVREPEQLPFLLSQGQGEAARRLMSYVASLPLPGPDAQLLAAVSAIRAARGGVANVTGADLAALRLTDPHQAVNALRDVGWQLADTVLDSDPAAPPTRVTVPELAPENDHPLPRAKLTRSRVSGWTARTLSAKPLKKLPPAARLAGLYLAAHGTSGLLTPVPADLPEACRPALPSLLEKGFLAELSGECYRLDPRVGHLAGVRVPAPDDGAAARDPSATAAAGTRKFQFDADTWAAWKDTAGPALRQHVESVENCALCRLRPFAVAEAFSGPSRPQNVSEPTRILYEEWKEAHPDRGPQAAAFTVDFRDRHGHGPSYKQLGKGMGWKVSRELRGYIVRRLVQDAWLMGTGTVPWTLRPGPAAQEQGITLPRARGAQSTALSPS
ncbi:hypothetical protein [Streptomyces sp. NPDC052494]|uniref:hypothetical protein n=1 Tax=Streptomyces sp. NPDC052494 TaxID=3365692 RepID=UPI0037CD97B5